MEGETSCFGVGRYLRLFPQFFPIAKEIFEVDNLKTLSTLGILLLFKNK